MKICNMAGEDNPVPNCNCTKTLAAIKDLRTDIEDYKTQVLIIHWVLAVVLAILVVSTVSLFYWLRKLQRIVSALDPMSKYQRVGPSLYVKKARRDTSSISSSFKHFNRTVENENDIYSNPDVDHPRNDERSKKRSNVGTLDRNFFTNSNFSFENPLSQQSGAPESEASLNRRKISDPEVQEAVAKLDKAIY